MDNLVNIFCELKKTEKESVRIKRISISGDIQNDLSGYFIVDNLLKAEQIEFSGEYKPDEGQVLYINNFDFVHRNELSLTCETITVDEIVNIKYLFFKYDENTIVFQTFDNRKIIKPEKWLLIYSNDTFSKIDNKGLTIDSKIDALFIINEKKLLFTSYHNASKIFNLNDYFKEATDSEVKNFYQTDIFIDNNSLELNKFNSRMRKKIFLISKNGILDKVKENFETVCGYAKELGLENMFDEINKKIKFPSNEKEIGKLIDFLNEDLFKSPISNSIYETNSKRKLK
ncbi:MAG: hypothetical protein ACK4EX_03490 [Thermaurantimonas sp.]|uniref:hypothetical protein n=1 Tax=Thermaurantimonas sp. TaxID=2681568 RepID=UPI0039193AA5